MKGRLEQQAKIAQLGLTALESSDWESVADEALEVVSQELDTPLCAVLELLPENQTLVIRKARGWNPETVGSTIPAGSGSQAGYTLVTGRPVVIDDMTAEPRFRIPPVVHEHGAVSSLSVIMTGPDGPYGVMGAHTRERRTFTEDDINFMQSVANIVATAVYRARTEGMLRERQIQFLQAQKMEAVGLLAGGVAHDFNNLLTVILGYTDTLLGRLSAGPEREELLRIRTAGDRAASLIRQLLAFSSQQVMEPRVLDLGVLLEEMRSMLARLLGASIRLILTRDEELWPIKSDPGQIEQVLVNLVLNARDAMPRGGSLVIRAANVPAEDLPHRVRSSGVLRPCVLLSVADTGAGITAEMQGRIFEPFFTTKPVGRGTGLGLSGVYGIVQQNQGAITVDSAPGRGAVFSIFLPRSLEALSPRVEEPRRAGSSPGHETILLVEDEDVVRTLETSVLSREGYHVLAARSAVEALETLRKTPSGIDLVITDVVMPEMSGPELVDRLHAERPGLRVLFVSGYAREALPDGRLSQKGVAFLQKPFHPESFLNSVREVLDHN